MMRKRYNINEDGNGDCFQVLSLVFNLKVSHDDKYFIIEG